MSKLVGGTIKVLDHGYVTLVDYMGDDTRIDDSARISYTSREKQQARTPAQIERLVRYLIRHGHTSPLEQVVFVFHLKLPIFVQRQLIRHRTARVNEISARYSVLPCDYFVPDDVRICAQSETNKQASGAPLDGLQAKTIRAMMTRSNESSSQTYDYAIGNGVSREIARTVLPVSTYTELVWQMDLNNLLRFIELRLDKHAQPEIQVYARAMAKFVSLVCPIAFSAWEELVWRAVKVCPADDHRVEAILAARRDPITFDGVEVV